KQVEASGLAGAVRSDQRVDVSAPYAQVHVAHGNETGKFPGQCAGFENVLTQSNPPDTSLRDLPPACLLPKTLPVCSRVIVVVVRPVLERTMMKFILSARRKAEQLSAETKPWPWRGACSKPFSPHRNSRRCAPLRRTNFAPHMGRPPIDQRG